MKMQLFGGPRRRRVTVATYPDGRRFIFKKTRMCGQDYWQFAPEGSAAFPLSVAKAEAKDRGATVTTEYRP
jgi:hypothetical protein